MESCVDCPERTVLDAAVGVASVGPGHAGACAVIDSGRCMPVGSGSCVSTTPLAWVTVCTMPLFEYVILLRRSWPAYGKVTPVSSPWSDELVTVGAVLSAVQSPAVHFG